MMKEYEKFLHDKLILSKGKNAVLQLSGGTDSALAFYLICEFVVKENIQDFQITPIHGWDTARKHSYSPDAAKKIYTFIKQKFPTVKINDLYLFAYHKINKVEEKSKYHRPVYKLMRKEGKLDDYMLFSGVTLSPTDKSFKPKNSGNVDGSNRIKGRYKGMLMFYDKKWVSSMYKEKNLLEIFPYTVSCIADEKGPCKKCWWCEEKYWAFNAYDGDIIC